MADSLYEIAGDSVERDGHKYPAVEFEHSDGLKETLPEAYLHDSRALPHLMSGDIEKLFPRAIPAAEEPEDCCGQEDWLEARIKSKTNGQ